MMHCARVLMISTILAAPAAAAERELILLEPDGNAFVARDLWSVPPGGHVLLGTAMVAIDPASGLLMATIDQPDNPADGNGLGSVADTYRMTVYEITNTEYLEMLDAVAAADPNGLFNFNIMTDSDRGGLLQSGAPGSFTYSIKPEFANKPVNGVSWWDSARYCNWLHNGKPTGAQGPSTTEDGVYDLSLSGDLIVRKPSARYFIPTHDEWYKAAYYDPFDSGADGGGTVNYWLYPTRSDSVPIKATSTVIGDVANPGPNVANLDRGADWNGENGNVTTVGGTMASNAWGVADLAGNVNEPTETLGTPIPANPPDQPDPLPTRRLRGGDFANVEILASSPPGFSGSLNMLAEAANIGFRVAAKLCPVPGDPTQLLLNRQTDDVLLTWDDPGGATLWNVYRDGNPDRTTWGAALHSGVSDETPAAPGIQFLDPGAINAGSPLFYLVTAITECGGSAL